MKILYVFPHPDDESFGPARVMHKQLRDGHEVYLLTLTRGGATKQRHRLGLSVEAMGEVRYQEMLEVEKVLGLSGMTVLDLPDSGLKEMDPRDIEKVVQAEIERVEPNVLMTYPVHGISGFHDHLVIHAVMKRVFLEMKESRPWLQRLAFFTLAEADASDTPIARLHFSTTDEIDCIVTVDDADVDMNRSALDCYVTYQETIAKSGIKEKMGKRMAAEFFQEFFDPPVGDVFAGLKSSGS